VTDVVSLEYYHAVASILQVPQENLSWYSAFNINISLFKHFSQSHKRLYVRSIWRFCVRKFVGIEPGSLSGVRLLRHGVQPNFCGHTPSFNCYPTTTKHVINMRIIQCKLWEADTQRARHRNIIIPNTHQRTLQALTSFTYQSQYSTACLEIIYDNIVENISIETTAPRMFQFDNFGGSPQHIFLIPRRPIYRVNGGFLDYFQYRQKECMKCSVVIDEAVHHLIFVLQWSFVHYWSSPSITEEWLFCQKDSQIQI